MDFGNKQHISGSDKINFKLKMYDLSGLLFDFQNNFRIGRNCELRSFKFNLQVFVLSRLSRLSKLKESKKLYFTFPHSKTRLNYVWSCWTFDRHLCSELMDLSTNKVHNSSPQTVALKYKYINVFCWNVN